MTTKDRVASRPAGAKVTGTWTHLRARRVAYAVKEGPLHVDGAAGPAGEGARGVSFSEDGAHIGYYLKRGAEGRFIKDNDDRGGFAAFGMLPPVWSSDGHAAFTARKIDASTGKAEWWIVVDGEARFGPFSDDQPGFGSGKSKLVWSPKGIAYVASNGESMRIEIEGAPLGEAFALVRDPLFFGDGAKFAYRAQRDTKWWLVSADRVNGPFDACEEPVFAPDGRLFFVATDADRAKLYVDGAVVDEYPKVHELAVAVAVGTTAHALIAGDGTQRRVVHGAWQSDDYANLLGLDITPDGAHTSVVADKDGQEHIVVDGVVVASAASIPHGATTLSGDGAHAAFLVKGKQAQEPSHVGIDDDVRSEPFDNLWSEVVFAADDQSVAFMAEQGDEMHVFTLDAGAAKVRTRPASAAAMESRGGAGVPPAANPAAPNAAVEKSPPVEAPPAATPPVAAPPAASPAAPPAAAPPVAAPLVAAPLVAAPLVAAPLDEADAPAARGATKKKAAAKTANDDEAALARKAAPKKAAAKRKSDDDDEKPAKKAAPKKAAKAKR